MTAWAAGTTPSVRLLGMVLVVDAPGRLPRDVRYDIRVLAGGVPRLWQLPWSEDHRAGVLDQPSRPVAQLVAEITAILRQANTP